MAAEQAAQHAQKEALAGSSAELPGKYCNGTQALKPSLQLAIKRLQRGLVERDVEARLLLLAALSSEHILFIGPPGTAKSELGRRLSQLLSGPFFERLLTRFSVPEVISKILSSIEYSVNDEHVLSSTLKLCLCRSSLVRCPCGL